MDTRFPTGTVPVIGASSQPANGASDRPVNGTSTVPTAIARERRYAARNYDPLPVVLAHGDGCWLWDEHGRRYLDMMSAYSAVSHGHAHPRIVRALVEQAQRLAVTSRVFHNELLPALLKRLTEVTGLDRALPANGGAEAVETALKAARKWGHKIKGIPADSAEIIVCAGNFHGRSITIVGFSSEPQYRDGLRTVRARIQVGSLRRPRRAGPCDRPEHGRVPRRADPGRRPGIIVPPAGYLAQCARICRDNNVLLICDEIQTGMGRTGKFLACEHEHVRPDGVILGKALGGGLLPVSCARRHRDLMQVFTPGDHGSTFGGNPLASAVALTALDVLFEEGTDRARRGAGCVSPRPSSHGQEPVDQGSARQGTVHRRRSRSRPHHCARCRRPSAGAWNSVERHARHRRTVRAAAYDRSRDTGLGGRRGARGIRGAGRRTATRGLRPETRGFELGS
jgi:ornithine--oxo-acid transaminase